MKLITIYNWIKHVFKAKKLKQIHSPFLYELCKKFSKPCSIDKSDINKLKLLRKSYINNKSELVFNEIGSREGKIESTVSEVFKRTSKPISQAIRIAELASIFNEETILEMGTAFGSTTMAINMAAPKNKIISIEGVEQIAKIASETFKNNNLKNIDLKIGNFQQMLADVINQNNKISFAFIDGHHLKEPTLEYIKVLIPALSEKSAILIDDIYCSKSMAECWKELIDNNFFSVKIDFFHFGLLIKNDDLYASNFKFLI